MNIQPTTTTVQHFSATVQHFWVILGKDYDIQDGHAIPDQTEEFNIALSEGETLESYFSHWIEEGWQIEANELSTPPTATEQEEF